MNESKEGEVPKTMLILKSHPGALATVETFLRNRGWQITSTANLKEALVQAVSRKPNYILISMDHAHKKARALPRVLAQAVPAAAVMVFAENQTSASYNVLNGCLCDYKVYPPITGPAIERCVNKYLKDQQTRASVQMAGDSLKGEGASANDMISIKGGLLPESEDASRLLSQFLDEDERAQVQKGVSGKMDPLVPADAPAGMKEPPLGSREYRRNHSPPAWEPMKKEESLLPSKEVRKARRETKDTLIARGTQKSLEESVNRRDGKIHVKIQDTTSAACILVESRRFSGYLVAVMGNNMKIDKAFIETVKQRLFKFLKANGEDISDNQAMDIKIRPVDFEPWALEYADFLRKSVHEGHEIAMAFFPRRPVKAILEDSPQKEMARIHLSELQGDRPVEFDLYVYLPNNDKYVLYTPKGGVFYNKQMDRLKKQGVTHMHIQKEAAQAVSKYRAQNYLNDMVEDYEKNRAGSAETSEKSKEAA